MQIWPALIVAPLLVLSDQSIAFALVGWSCANQTMLAMHGAHLLFLVLSLAATLIAWQRWRETNLEPSHADGTAQTHFLAGVATATGTLSTMAILAMWAAAWVLSSCVS